MVALRFTGLQSPKFRGPVISAPPLDAFDPLRTPATGAHHRIMADKSEAMGHSPIEMEQPLGIYAADLLGRGCEFLEAFKVLSFEGDSRHRHPQYFILAHALELILKAYLAARGVKKETLLRIGHKIIMLEHRSRDMGLPELENLDRLVAAIAEMNGDHDFRYPTGFNLFVPAPDLCLPIMEQLLMVARPVVSSACLADELDLASKTRHLHGKKIAFNDPPKTNAKKPGG